MDVLKVGEEIEIRNTEGKGRGLFGLVWIRKGQFVTDYDGHRVDPITGEVKMICSKMQECMQKLSPAM